MKAKKLDAPEWFFMWTTGQPYVTSICGWVRGVVIADVLRSGIGYRDATWKQIYRQGGRVIRCKVTPV